MTISRYFAWWSPRGSPVARNAALSECLEDKLHRRTYPPAGVDVSLRLLFSCVYFGTLRSRLEPDFLSLSPRG